MEREDFGVLMAAHGGLAKGYVSALKLVLDIDDTDLDIVSFEEGESTEEFEQQLKAVIEGRYGQRNLVILLDIPGGTPANTALRFLSDSRRLIAGANLAVAVEVMMAKKNHTPWEELDLDSIAEDGKNSVVYYNRLLKEEQAYD